MESVDRVAMCRALYRALLSFDGNVDNVIAASAEGYAFPTNLDRDQPVDGLAPPTQAGLVRQALSEKWDEPRFESALAAQTERRLP
jgi:hypothetical protein